MNKLILTAIAAVAIIFSACNNQTKSSDSQENSSNVESTMLDSSHTLAAVQYTCPMHPEVISDKPGKCPKCGMDLVEKKEGSNSMSMDSTSMDSMNHMH